MKISIITPSLNSEKTIEETIKSVLSQTYKDIEYIIIDGGSKDKTIEIVDKYRDKISKIVSEKDKGIYDGMNKGIKLATGEIVGILNSDDLYFDESVIENVMKVFKENKIDCLWGDLVYFKDDPNKFIRVWKGGNYRPGIFKTGWVPPHPTFFVKKEIYEKYGYFRLDFPVAADYELMLRFLEKYRVKGYYLPKFLVKMRAGGNANKLKNIIKGNLECIRAWKVNGLKMPFYTPFFRILRRIPQILKI
ncbi:MAG: glycosyltransferase family 2 protein [Candidatus Aenigmatarchaeota archaeon]